MTIALVIATVIVTIDNSNRYYRYYYYYYQSQYYCYRYDLGQDAEALAKPSTTPVHYSHTTVSILCYALVMLQ